MLSCASRRLVVVSPWRGFSTQRRSFSKSFSSYEYPLRTEAPQVTRTTSQEAQKQQQKSTLYAKPPPPTTSSSPTSVDHFDDLHTLDPLEQEARRAAQKLHLSTTLQGSTEITPSIPPSIPPNVDSTQLQVPTTHLSTLKNGVRVVSQETYSQVCTIGVLLDAGSRHESVMGTCHLMELLAFHSTKTYPNALQLQHQLQEWGATSFANTGREQTLYCLDILRPNVDKGMQLLEEVVLQPLLLPEEVELCKKSMEYQAMDMLPEIQLGEVLQKAAYGPNQQLGKPHFCPIEALPFLNANVVRSFHGAHIQHNPQGLVVAGAGIDHEELVDLAEYHFGHLSQHTLDETERSIPSIYRGGAQSLQHSSVDGFTRVALSFELGGWHSDDLVPTCILQTLLGGGNSFSAGGPGKGMYSRLYRQVLNRYYWAESAEAFTAFHNESGLFGISGSSSPQKTLDMCQVLAEHFQTLSQQVVTDEELERARNMLKNNVLTQLESRLVLFEDMGRQVLTYGYREDVDTMVNKIDAVTKQDLLSLIQRAMEKPPTLAAVGDDLRNVPSYDQVNGWFN